MKDRDIFYGSIKNVNSYDHPSGYDLYLYYLSRWGKGEQLGPVGRNRIIAHMNICDECSRIVHYMVKTSSLLNFIVGLSERAEDKAAVKRSLKWFRNNLAQLKKEELEKPLVSPWALERIFKDLRDPFALISLGGQKVSQINSSGFDTLATKHGEETAWKDLLISWHIRRKQSDILFIPSKNLVSARLFLQDNIIFKEQHWPARQGRSIEADLIIKDHQAPAEVWEFKDKVLWFLQR